MDTVNTSSNDTLVNEAVGAAVAAVVAAVVGTLAQMAIRAVVRALTRRRDGATVADKPSRSRPALGR